MSIIKASPGFSICRHRHCLLRACTIAAAFILSTQLPAVAGSPQDWLRRVIINKGNTNCAGERVLAFYQDGRLTRSVKQVFSFKKGGKQYIETVAPEAEEGSLIVSNGVTLWEYSPKTRRVVKRRLETAQMRESSKRKSASLIASGVDVINNGGATIAGRKVFVATLKSKCGQVLRKYWIDAATGVELRCDKYRGGNEPYMSTRITSISYTPTYVAGMFDFTPPTGSLVTQAPKPLRRMSLKSAEKLAGFTARQPGYIPPGYVFEGENVAVTTYQGKLTLWLTYTNGLDTFSLFQTRSGSGEQTSKPCRDKCAIQWCSYGRRFTLVGNLPKPCEQGLVKSLQER